jgi:hypothetical protein
MEGGRLPLAVIAIAKDWHDALMRYFTAPASASFIVD